MTTQSCIRALAICGLLVLGAAASSCRPATSTAARGGCETIGIAASDVASTVGLLATAGQAVPGDSASCEFGIGSGHIQVSVRPALGRLTVDSWITGRMPLHALTLAGVGDAAVWQPELHEVIAEQNDVLCDVSLSGANADAALPAPAELAKRLASLCTKIFAASPRGGAINVHSSRRDQ